MSKITANKKPYILIKTAISLDGYIDDLSTSRLVLSNQADTEAVDALKSTFDAILVGAQTIRKDNPSLLIKSSEHSKKRIEKGLTEHPIKVTVSLSGELDVNNRFFQEGHTEKIVYCPNKIKEVLKNKIGHAATVVGLLTDDSSIINPINLLEDLYARGVNRLMIEGGGIINSMFLKPDLVDAMRIAIAPFFVGEQDAPRFTLPLNFPYNKDKHMKLEKSEILGDMVILNYKLN